MADRNELIRTAEIRRPILEFGDGVTAGEVWDSEVFVEDGVVKESLVIKMTDELRARFGHLMKDEDLREGFIEWREIRDLMILITSNPSSPRIFALRSFDHQATPFSLLNNTLIESMKRMSKEIANLKMGVHSEQEIFRKFMEGGGWIRVEEIVRRVVGEELAKFAANLQRK